MDKRDIKFVFEEISGQTGLPQDKAEEYVRVFREAEIYNKPALYLAETVDLELLCQSCNMGVSTKNCLLNHWKAGNPFAGEKREANPIYEKKIELAVAGIAPEATTPKSPKKEMMKVDELWMNKPEEQ